MSEESKDSRKVDAAFNRFVKSLKKDVRHEEWVQRKPTQRQSIAERIRQQMGEKENALSPEKEASRDKQQNRARQAAQNVENSSRQRDIERER